MPQFKSGWCLQCPKGVSLWDFYFYLFLYLYSLSRHTCAGIFCFYLESGEVCCAKRWTVAFLSLPGGKLQTKRKDTKEKPQCLLAQKERLDRALPCLFAARTIPLYVPFCCAKRWTVDSRLSRVGSCKQKEKVPRKILDTFWRRRRDSNSRAGCPTYALSRGASSPT